MKAQNGSQTNYYFELRFSYKVLVFDQTKQINNPWTFITVIAKTKNKTKKTRKYFKEENV